MKIGYEQKAGDKSAPFDDFLEPIINELVCYIKASLKHFTAKGRAELEPRGCKNREECRGT
jgi:hypothetical protein